MSGAPADVAAPGRRRAGPLAILALACLVGLGTAACAGGGTEGRAVPAVDSRAEAPERTASERLVERGRALLAVDSAAGAASVLERAVRVDPSNGRAYLELARARIRLGEPSVARGLLQRAAALLRPYPELEARVDSLQATLGGA